jgi:hypothetical protein
MLAGRWNIWGVGILIALFTGTLRGRARDFSLRFSYIMGCCSHALSALLRVTIATVRNWYVSGT